MAYGYHDRILRLDLTRQEITIEEPGEIFFRTYLGGWGVIAHYLLKELTPGVDPLAPQNLLIFAPGVITGAPVGGSGRHAVGAKSPLTGGFGASEVGGFWGAELKHAGWDGIVISGRADKPVYVAIRDGEVGIYDAAHLWGRATADVEAMIREELGDQRVRVAQCGVAGENGVRFACVMHDVGRAAGRTGLGAVMGAKQLKAVAVRGSGRVQVADPDRVKTVARWLRDRFMQDGYTRMLHEHGTDGLLISLSAVGGLPTRNFQQGSFEGAEKISGETMSESILLERASCFACPVSCKRRVGVKGRYNVDPVYGGPEYETAAALGSLCGIDDLEAVAHGNQLCNAYGLDTISTGVVIAWAMECFERGLLTEQDTGGLELRWGNAEAMIGLIEQIACRQGLGDLMAEGSLRAAQAIGRGTERYAMQVKGQEIPMHEPRIKFALNIGYATSPTGADHMHNTHDTALAREGLPIQHMRSLGIPGPVPADDLGPEKVRLFKYRQAWRTLHNCLVTCMMLRDIYGPDQIRDMVQGVTGWNTTLYELMKVSERALAMARAFNYREGFRPRDDVAHWRFSTPFEDGPAKGVRVPAEEMERALELHYQMNGWDKETGAPTAGTLHELGLHWLAELLYGPADSRLPDGGHCEN
jgi:aldehyde:ferredoxin oxidoreductase